MDQTYYDNTVLYCRCAAMVLDDEIRRNGEYPLNLVDMRDSLVRRLNRLYINYYLFIGSEYGSSNCN